MQDILEFIKDLETLEPTPKVNNLISKYQKMVDDYEAAMDREFKQYWESTSFYKPEVEI